MRYEHLINEVTQLGAERLLERLPAEQRGALVTPVYQVIRDAILHYATALETAAWQLDPLGPGPGR